MDKIKRILIAVDDVSASEMIALKGFELSQQLSAEVALVSAVDTEFIMSESSLTPDELAETQEESFKQCHQLLRYKVFNDREIQTFIYRGEPREVILKTAQEWQADLIVVGSHGRTGLSHLLMGSVAEEVINHSTKPILIIPIKS